MGCAQSKNEYTKTGLATPSMVAGMTAGELADYRCPHNSTIEAALEAAKEEIAEAPTRSLWDYYDPDMKLIGRGAFARVFKSRCLATKQDIAVKVISRDAKAFQQQRRAMVTKIATMRTLKGHPNMLDLHEVFEDGEGYHVVVEYLPGQALFDTIAEHGHFTERDAALIMKQLLEFLQFAHSKNVVHRDIKPENLLLLDRPHEQSGHAMGFELSSSDGAKEEGKEGGTQGGAKKPLRGIEGRRLKVIDFGTAGFCEPGQHLHSKVGTAQYVAPEVLDRDYDKSSDIWSAGVVMYILLCGHTPFEGSTMTGTFNQVKSGKFRLEGRAWAHVHESAKDLLHHMLVVDAEDRWSASACLEHPWFREVLAEGGEEGRPLAPDYMERLHEFVGMARMKRLSLKLLSHTGVRASEMEELQTLFGQLDTDGDGLIDGEAFKKGLAAAGTTLSEKDVEEFMGVCQIDRHSTTIDFNEFLAALGDSKKVAQRRPSMVLKEFEGLDVDHDGYITAEDLVIASKAPSGAILPGVNATLGVELSLEEAKGILDEVDHTKRGRVSFEQFKALIDGRPVPQHHSQPLPELIDVAAAKPASSNPATDVMAVARGPSS